MCHAFKPVILKIDSVTPPELPETALCTPGLNSARQFVTSAPEGYCDCVSESDCNFRDSSVSKLEVSESNFVPVLETSEVCVSGLTNVPGDDCTLVPIKHKTVTDTQPDCKVPITTSSGNSKDPPVATMVKVAKEAYSHEQATSKTKFSFPELTSPKTASSNLESLRTADFLRPTNPKSIFCETVFGTINLVFPVTVTLPGPTPKTELDVSGYSGPWEILSSIAAGGSGEPSLPSAPRAARARLSPAHVPAHQLRVAEAQLVPALVPRLAEAPFVPAPISAPRVGMADNPPVLAPVPVLRRRAAVTLLTPAPVSVPRVGEVEVQLAPASRFPR